ncbi:MAG: hypothetical protein CMJ49_04785 [Planctomycetaceae bacterium]|nr:hypothetical protein [Planctomycetaceae bacterium]
MSEPKLAVVIASCVGAPFITRCLASLETQRDAEGVEFIVVDRAGGETAKHIASQFSWARLISAEAPISVPDLRRRGIDAASAEYVAIIEEHCTAAPDWIATILKSLAAEPAAALGGPVHDNGYRKLMDWAVYFTEYNSYLPPYEAGALTNICAANCVYRRDLMVEHLPAEGSGYWEAVVNWKLAEAGHAMRSEPSMIVRHTGPFGFGYYLGQRYLFSRAFAGVSRSTKPKWYPLLYLICSPLLVVLLWLRTAQRVFGKQHRKGKFLLATPILIPVCCTYVIGELMGYLRGPGDALDRIE